MAAQVKVGSFTWSGGASGPQAITGVGFQPKLLIVSGGHATAYETFLDGQYTSVGFAVGSGASARTVFYSSNYHGGVVAPSAEADIRTSEIASFINSAGIAEGLYGVASFDADGFTLTSTFGVDGERFQYIAIGGDDVEVAAGVANWPTAAGAQAITGVGFSPTTLLFGAIVDTSNFDGCVSLGWCDAQLNQGVTANHYYDSWANPSDSDRYMSASAAIVLQNHISGNVDAAAAVESLDADGFTLQWSAGVSPADSFLWVAIRGVASEAGVLQQPSSPGDQVISGLGVAPEAVLFQSSEQTALDTQNDDFRLGIGFGAVGANFNTWSGDLDNQANMASRNSVRYSHDGASIVSATPSGIAAGTVTSEAAVSAVANDGFTLSWATADATARQVLFLALGATPPPPVFTLGGALSGIVGPLYWTKIVHKDAAGDPAVFPWAPVTIADPASYYDGLKEAKLLSIGEISCPLSDRTGRLQVPTCDVTYSDLPNASGLMTLRGMLGRDTQRVLKNAEFTVYAITDEARRALLDPEIMFRGYIDRYSGASDYQFTINARGWIAKRLKAPLWSETVRDVFPAAPVTARGVPLPIALGALSDQGSATAAPTAVLDETGRGGAISPEWISSYGDIATPPANLVLAEDAAAGNLAAGTYYGMVTRIVAGVESDPEPFLPNGEPITVSANAAIEMTCDDDSADAYRFYLGQEVAGGGEVLFSQYIETVDPTTPVVFTDLDTLSASAVTATNLFGSAAVLAVMADGRTVLSAVAFVRTAGYLRPVRLAWDPVPSALSYEVYFRLSPTVSAQPYERMFAVATSQVNSNSDPYWEWLWGDDAAYALVDGAPVPEGVFAPVYVGVFTDNQGFADWKGFLVSARPCTDGTLVPYLDGVRVDPANYTTTWAIPGEGSWSTWFGPDLYYGVSGYRLWMMFVRGPEGDAIAAGTSTLRVNVDGLEDAGDGTGATITSIYEQLRVIAQNCLLADTPDLTGDFDVVPVFSDSTPRLDLTSLAAAVSNAAAVIAGGPAGSRWLPGSLTGDQFFQDWCPSAIAKVGIKPNGQMVVAVHNPAASPAAHLEEYSEILDRSYGFDATDQGFANVLPYSYEARYDSPTSFSLEVEGEAEAAGSIADHNERVTDQALSLNWRRSSAIAGQIADAFLAQSAYLPQVGRAESVLHWVYRAPGDHVTLSHRQGPSEAGYDTRLHAVLGMSVSLSRMTVGLTLLDLDPGGSP
jgi:hypothetical protein